MFTASLFMRELGKEISSRRQKMGLSQEQLAFKAGLHRTYISNIERGSRKISLVTLGKISQALGEPASCLMQYAEQASVAVVVNGTTIDGSNFVEAKALFGT